MLLANESVARMLADRDVPCAYRVHERPSPEDLRATVRPLMELGLIDGNAQREALIAGEPEAINTVLDAARGTSGEFLASALLLRAQKRAIYLPTNQGHYALGAQAYCHFTSPIRRYPDELVHRALKALLAGTLGSREQEQARGQLRSSAPCAPRWSAPQTALPAQVSTSRWRSSTRTTWVRSSRAWCAAASGLASS